MSLVTNWGYTITDRDDLRDFIDENEFNVFSGNKYNGDVRTASEISAASAAIRNYVGWHLYPSAECEFSEFLLYGNGRIKSVGHDVVIQLPAKFVTDVSSVFIDNEEVTDYVFGANGIVHIFDVHPRSRKSKISVSYTAGLSAEMIAGIAELVSHRVTHSLASSNGITSEAAGGVSVTYNANWVNSARATALPDDNKEVLAPYRLQGVF